MLLNPMRLFALAPILSGGLWSSRPMSFIITFRLKFPRMYAGIAPADTQYIVPGCNLTLYRRIKRGGSDDKIINENTAVQKLIISKDKEYAIEWFNEASYVLEF